MREEQRAAVPEDSRRPVVRFDGDCGAEVLCVERTLLLLYEVQLEGGGGALPTRSWQEF